MEDNFMERNELVAKIEEIMPIVNKWIAYNNLRNSTAKKIKTTEQNITYIKPNVFKDFGISFGICFLFGGILLLPIEWLTDIKIKFPFYFVFTIVLTFILLAILNKSGKKRVTEQQEALVRLKAEYSEIENKFNREITPHMQKIYAIFPRDYAYPNTIKQLYTYLVNRRADNLKEAINLFEQERQQTQQQQILNSYGEQLATMQRNQQQLEQRVAEAEAEADYVYRRSISKDI